MKDLRLQICFQALLSLSDVNAATPMLFSKGWSEKRKKESIERGLRSVSFT